VAAIRASSPISSFYEIRYSGKAAALVRAFRAVYLGLFFNIVIMSTVNLAAAKIANVLLGMADVADARRVRGHQHRVRIDCGLVGRLDHRRLPIRDRDDGIIRGGILLAEPAAGRRTVGPHGADPAIDAASCSGLSATGR
jgi:hypothetical protein